MTKLVFLIVVLLVVLVGYLVFTRIGSKKEVYLITSLSGGYETSFADAPRVAKLFDPNAELATYDQVNESFKAGAQWCSAAWMADGRSGFPMQGIFPGCGSSQLNIWGSDTRLANVMVYGVKPSEEEANQMRKDKGITHWVFPFYQPVGNDPKPRKWSQYDP